MVFVVVVVSMVIPRMSPALNIHKMSVYINTHTLNHLNKRYYQKNRAVLFSTVHHPKPHGGT